MKKGAGGPAEKRVTVYDVAKELGISTSTVSRVLNNSILIGEEKRDSILAAARRLGYHKRPIKKQMRRAILNIKLFLPVHRYVYTHLFYNVADLIAGLYDGFGDVRVNIITKLAGLEDDIFRTKKLGDIDGCIFAFSEPEEEIYGRIGERGIPVVELNRINEKRNYVSCDNALGMETLLARVVRRRKDGVRPCYLGFTQIPAVEEQRRRGFLSAVKNLSLPAGEKDLFILDALADISPELLKDLKKKGYNTVMCFNDVLAVYFFQAAVAEGFSIPGDFSLTGFDNSPVLDLVSRRIDTINLSVRILGFEAGKWLKARIIDREEKDIHKLIAGEYVQGSTIG
jgi:LacI family transcriptional regulator